MSDESLTMAARRTLFNAVRDRPDQLLAAADSLTQSIVSPLVQSTLGIMERRGLLPPADDLNGPRGTTVEADVSSVLSHLKNHRVGPGARKDLGDALARADRDATASAGIGRAVGGRHDPRMGSRDV